MRPIEFKSLTIQPLGRTKMLLKWDMAPTLANLSDYTIILERSYAPEEDFTKLINISSNLTEYIDEKIHIFKLWEDVYARITVTDNRTGESYIAIKTRLGYPPDVYALEFIRRLEITLKNKSYGVGVPVYFFLRKRGGSYCRECFDPLKKRVLKSTCSNCYRVGYEGGFYKAIPGYVAFTPDIKLTAITDRGEGAEGRHNSYTMPYPLLYSGDLIYDARLGRLWEVSTVSMVERRRHPVKQNLQLNEVDKSSVFYTMCEERIRELK